VSTNNFILSMAILVATLAISHFYQRHKTRKMESAIRVAKEAMEARDWPKAQAAMEGCVAAHPSWAAARRMLAHALASQGMHKRAEEEIRMAIALEPREWEHQVYLATYLLQVGRRDEGLRLLREVFSAHAATRETLRGDAQFLGLLREEERAALFG